MDRAHADLLGVLALVAHIDVRGRVVAHQHRGEPGNAAVVRVAYALTSVGDPAADLGCNRLAVDDRRSHQLAFFSGA